VSDAVPALVTIEDVAAHAGVSVATVSRALRGLPNVAPTTRDKVRAVALQLGYRADPNASRLGARRTRTIGVGVPLLGSWYFSQVVAGAEAVLAAEGYDVLLLAIGSAAARRRMVDGTGPLHRRVDGLLLVDLRLDPDEVATFARTGATIVTVGDSYPDFPSVAIDDRRAAALAVNHLLNLGHRDIALIGDLPGEALEFTVPGIRRAAYRQALGDAGVPVRLDYDLAGNFSVDGGHEAMVRLLATPRPPTAVFAMSDEMAIGAISAVRDHGLSVPGDISVVGFDDHELAEAVGLTTVRQPVAQVGGLAARAALGVLDEVPSEPRHLVVDTSLVVRGTTQRRT
jgi:LacI family transcriptional regulator, repressor for deo operon, udp, cdd, tsx, nupC, and nupG